MKSFAEILDREMLRLAVKDDLIHAKAWLSYAHERLSNNDQHQLAGYIYELMERINELIMKLS
jgi:hypothetical protein